MEQIVRIQYVNTKQAWLLSVNPAIQLTTEVYKGKLVFRVPGTSQRVSYHRIKEGLIKKQIIIQQKALPF